MNIRQADLNDISDIVKLFSEVVNSLPYYNTSGKQLEIEAHNAIHLSNQMANEPGSIWVATESSIIVGVAITGYDYGTAYLYWLVVDEKYRRQGIADKLLNAIESHWKDNNVHKMWCDTRTTNRPMIDFLSKHKWIGFTMLRNHWYNQDFYLWEKLI